MQEQMNVLIIFDQVLTTDERIGFERLLDHTSRIKGGYPTELHWDESNHSVRLQGFETVLRPFFREILPSSGHFIIHLKRPASYGEIMALSTFFMEVYHACPGEPSYNVSKNIPRMDLTPDRYAIAFHVKNAGQISGVQDMILGRAWDALRFDEDSQAVLNVNQTLERLSPNQNIHQALNGLVNAVDSTTHVELPTHEIRMFI